ncbi:unnamed protein product [Caenorhabditis sp. 36 PRJEB53466]|nr:unnamed protein product [Caenorhabditis sp. 36 PRJEB53466]
MCLKVLDSLLSRNVRSIDVVLQSGQQVFGKHRIHGQFHSQSPVLSFTVFLRFSPVLTISASKVFDFFFAGRAFTSNPSG